MKRSLFLPLMLLMSFVLCQCADTGGYSGGGSAGATMGGPTSAERAAQIAAEPSGSYFVGRRYYIQKTRFWGYVRKPGQPWKTAKLVMINESKMAQPDRKPETRGAGSYGYDQNYEYKLRGYYTGDKVYDPNSNQILPEFMLTGAEVTNKDPGWIFSPSDRYYPLRPTLRP